MIEPSRQVRRAQEREAAKGPLPATADERRTNDLLAARETIMRSGFGIRELMAGAPLIACGAMAMAALPPKEPEA